MTAAMQDVFAATVQANVSLIKSIPAQYFTQIEGIVMRGVQTGYDLKQITDDLQHQFKVSRKRAAFIARDQASKATSTLGRARQMSLGITKAIWVHSHAGKVPRPEHVKMDGKEYDLSEGMFDPVEGKYIFPGQLINCRCFSRGIVPGFS
jgi:SPP1 gp7 family putative phage head morphogenesis protein